MEYDRIVSPLRRLTASSIVLSAALVLSLLAAGSSGASLRAKGKVVSVTLTPSASFTAAQAAKTKLVCKFSPASKRVVLLLSTKKGSSWVKVRSVSKYGSTKAYTTTVKSLFGSKPVKVGKYRAKISAEANSITRNFTVKAPSPAPGGTDNGDLATPKAGLWWNGKSGDGKVAFYVDPTGKYVSHVGYWYHYSTGNPAPACSGDSAVGTPDTGALSQLWINDGFFLYSALIPPSNSSFAVNGTFDSPTSAYGSVYFWWKNSDCGDWTSGSVHWTATWQSSAQP